MENKETMAMMAPDTTEGESLIAYDYDNVMQLAARADRMVEALKKIMDAAIKITTKKDWTVIGGTPYLQETGASKVARLYGISWDILDDYPKIERDAEGYPTYIYRMTFKMGKDTIVADGARNARDEFFAGKKTDKSGNPIKQKSVDEIALDDVRRAAYTNCLNRGIKGLVPGLRQLEIADLERNGINIRDAGGYSFKTGSQGGNSGKAEDSGFICEGCGRAITAKVASYSFGKFGRNLCMNCQKNPPAVDATFGTPPPYGDDDVPPERG